MHDHEVEMHGVGLLRCREEINQGMTAATEQRVILGGSNDERLTNANSISITSFMPTSVSLLLLLPLTV